MGVLQPRRRPSRQLAHLLLAVACLLLPSALLVHGSGLDAPSTEGLVLVSTSLESCVTNSSSDVQCDQKVVVVLKVSRGAALSRDYSLTLNLGCVGR
jgi:hypothetical protein